MGDGWLFGKRCSSVVCVGDDGDLIGLCILQSLVVCIGALDFAMCWVVVYSLDSGFGNRRG
jgi:hypothetical protein